MLRSFPVHNIETIGLMDQVLYNDSQSWALDFYTLLHFLYYFDLV